MKFYEFINQEFTKALEADRPSLIIGQNVAAGSHLGGLTRGFHDINSVQVINSPNSENTLAGFALGTALGGVKTIFWLKQQDFVYLGLDALVNSAALIRNSEHYSSASCTFAMTVMDSGWEGPQASSNFSNQISQLTNIPALFASGLKEAEASIRISRNLDISLVVFSQKLLGLELSSFQPNGEIDEVRGIVNYRRQRSKGSMVVVTSNFAFQESVTVMPMLLSDINESIHWVNIYNPTRFLEVPQNFNSRQIIFLSDALVPESNIILHLKESNPECVLMTLGQSSVYRDRKPQDLSFTQRLIRDFDKLKERSSFEK